jgi:hypothetical protein
VQGISGEVNSLAFVLVNSLGLLWLYQQGSENTGRKFISPNKVDPRTVNVQKFRSYKIQI